MNIIDLTPDQTGLVPWPTLSKRMQSVVTVGSFDGMHQGHRFLIKHLVSVARKTKSLAVVIMFEPRPTVVHAFGRAHGGLDVPQEFADSDALTSLQQRLRMMNDYGIDQALVVHYTLAFASKSYRFFIGQLVERLDMRTLILGSDAALGAGRSGDAAAIGKLAEETGAFTLDLVSDQGPGQLVLPPAIAYQTPDTSEELGDPSMNVDVSLRECGETRRSDRESEGRLTRIWSSSNVRYLLSHGRIKAANAILGSRHAVEGIVVHGDQRGRTMGFPTVNLGGALEGFMPVDGVYAGWLVDLGLGKSSDRAHNRFDTPDFQAELRSDKAHMAPGSTWRWPAAISIGRKPTYDRGDQSRVLEAYAISDHWLELYGHKVRIEFAGFLRRQIRFADTQELVAAMKKNVNETMGLTSSGH